MSKLTLRPYQRDAVKAIIDSWRNGGTPYVNIMVGLGKTVIAADIIDKVLSKNKRILVLAPRKELVEQNYLEAYNYVSKPNELGICCGQIKKYQTSRNAVIAMPSSFVGRRTKSGSFDVLLCDEGHRWKIDGPDEKVSTYNKIYKSLIRLNPKMLVASLSGTCYRLDQGEMHEKSHKGTPIWTEKAYDASIDPGIPELIKQGFLSHIETLNTGVHVDLTGVRISGTDYNKDDMGVKFDQICKDAVDDMREKFNYYDISTALIFASNLKNARHILECWGDSSTMRLVHGGMTKSERENAIEWIKNEQGKRYICNVDILAEGFNMKHLQCCVLFRATKSPGLLVQMAGRVIRPHEDKERSFLIDYGTNCERLGNIDNIIVPKPKKRIGDAPKKLCTARLDENIEFEGIKYKKGQDCNYANLLSAKKCKKCSAEFISINEDGAYKMQTKQQALQAKIDFDTFEYNVDKVYYEKAFSRKDNTSMIKCRFYDEDVNHIHDSYLTLSHKGFARDNAIKMLISMLKNPSDYSDIAQFEGGINVDNVLLLLENEEYKERYFKRVKSITLAPSIKTKFKELKSISYF
jgi:DNA repair protein RadD